VTESKIALKSGFEKYLRVDKDGVVKGIADAVGSMEQWEPVFEVKAEILFVSLNRKHFILVMTSILIAR
jgi:hypothetical protein